MPLVDAGRWKEIKKEAYNHNNNSNDEKKVKCYKKETTVFFTPIYSLYLCLSYRRNLRVYVISQWPLLLSFFLSCLVVKRRNNIRWLAGRFTSYRRRGTYTCTIAQGTRLYAYYYVIMCLRIRSPYGVYLRTNPTA